jgi:ankyrin repeat protein
MAGLGAWAGAESSEDINAVDELGFTALDRAACRGHRDVVRRLLKCGADASLGWGLLLAAANGGLWDLVLEALNGELVRELDVSADRKAQIEAQIHRGINAVDSLGRTALYFAAGAGRIDICQALIKAGAKLEVNGRDIPASLPAGPGRDFLVREKARRAWSGDRGLRALWIATGVALAHPDEGVSGEGLAPK